MAVIWYLRIDYANRINNHLHVHILHLSQTTLHIFYIVYNQTVYIMYSKCVCIFMCRYPVDIYMCILRGKVTFTNKMQQCL